LLHAEDFVFADAGGYPLLIVPQAILQILLLAEQCSESELKARVLSFNGLKLIA
jgi:hypothetical protein